MSWLSSFLNPSKGYQKGQEQLDKYYQQAQGYQQPYNQQGLQQYGNLNTSINSLLNPEELYNKWASGYQESEAAKNAERLAQEHGLGAASAMGLMGSNAALNAIQQGTSGIAMNERQNYLNDLMDKYKTGTGLASGIYGQGAQAASQMGQNAMNQGQNSAQMAFGQQNANGQLLGAGLGALGGLAGSALGGPMGGALATRWGLSGGK